MRPLEPGELVGQSHLLGPGKILSRALEGEISQSLILWGPPGSGKTTIARMIAGASKLRHREHLRGSLEQLGWKSRPGVTTAARWLPRLETLLGVSVVRRDTLASPARAVLDAVNRRLPSLMGGSRQPR